jgi:molybdopterin/thiamine biosynthesis adenylyltransferase
MTPRQKERYSRQILFPGIQADGQERLLAAHAVIAGCGALGSFQAAALARAGVGRLTIVDRDYVEPSNLQRQWLFTEVDAAEALPKAAAAAHRLAEINQDVRVDGIVADLTAANIAGIFAGADVILDGTDNFETRYLINDYAVCLGTPWIYGAAVASYGLSMPVIPGRTACLRCVYPNAPAGSQPTCETAGVLNSITAAIAAVQVADALKILCGHGDSVRRRITTIDVWEGTVRQVDQPGPDPECPACGRRDFEFLKAERRAPVTLCGRNAVQIHDPRNLDLTEIKTRLEKLGEVRANPFALRFFVDPYEMTIFPDGRAIVKGTSDLGLARSLYAKYIGV